MSELYVIERMVIAEWMRDGSTLPIPYDLLDDAIADMLAAVRELKDILDQEGGNPSLLPGTNANQAYDASNVIERIILEHERRAGGKDQ